MKILRIAIPVAACVALLAAAPIALAEEAAKAAPKEGASSTDPKWDDMKLESKRQKIDAVTGETLEKLLKANPKAKGLFESSYGYAVFDNLKFAFFISGGGGKGEAVVRKTKTRTYMSVGSAGAGLSFGGQKCQIVFFFQDAKTFNDFVEKGWSATGAATATAGDAGAGAGTQFVNGIAYYQLGEKGLMASADISGSKFSKDKDLN